MVSTAVGYQTRLFKKSGMHAADSVLDLDDVEEEDNGASSVDEVAVPPENKFSPSSEVSDTAERGGCDAVHCFCNEDGGDEKECIEGEPRRDPIRESEPAAIAVVKAAFAVSSNRLATTDTSGIDDNGVNADGNINGFKSYWTAN